MCVSCILWLWTPFGTAFFVFEDFAFALVFGRDRGFFLCFQHHLQEVLLFFLRFPKIDDYVIDYRHFFYFSNVIHSMA